jgi:hypothetical protein
VRSVGAELTGVVYDLISYGSFLKVMSCSTRFKKEVRGAVDSVDSISDIAESLSVVVKSMLSLRRLVNMR